MASSPATYAIYWKPEEDQMLKLWSKHPSEDSALTELEWAIDLFPEEEFILMEFRALYE